MMYKIKKNHCDCCTITYTTETDISIYDSSDTSNTKCCDGTYIFYYTSTDTQESCLREKKKEESNLLKRKEFFWLDSDFRKFFTIDHKLRDGVKLSRKFNRKIITIKTNDRKIRGRE